MKSHRTWFTSDHHFGHRRIVEYCERPYQDAQDMELDLIAKWNTLIQPEDTVWYLGDFALYREKSEVERVLSQLRGQKHLVKGNHDHEQVRKAKGWCSVREYEELVVPWNAGSFRIVLSHYPLLSWNQMHYGSIHLHGHSHGKLSKKFGGKRIDVGVDANDFKPVLLEDVLSRSCGLTFEQVDHHVLREEPHVE